MGRETFSKDIEFRVMPNGDGGGWYWEIIGGGREVIT
jgi:hypothetical protein